MGGAKAHVASRVRVALDAGGDATEADPSTWTSNNAPYGVAMFVRGSVKNDWAAAPENQLWQFAVPFLAQNQMILKIVRSENGLLTTVCYKIGEEPTVYALEGSIAGLAETVEYWKR